MARPDKKKEKKSLSWFLFKLLHLTMKFEVQHSIIWTNIKTHLTPACKKATGANCLLNDGRPGDLQFSESFICGSEKKKISYNKQNKMEKNIWCPVCRAPGELEVDFFPRFRPSASIGALDARDHTREESEIITRIKTCLRYCLLPLFCQGQWITQG